MTARYTVVLSRLAEAQFDALIRADRTLGEQIAKAIDRLTLHPNLGEPLKGEWQGYRKYRSGAYRIVYRIEHARLMIYVISIGHRKDVYHR